MVDLLGKMECRHEDVDRLDPDERGDDSSGAVDEQIAPQQICGGGGPERDAAQGERDQGHDDQGVEDDRREDGALRGGRPIMLSAFSSG